MRGNKAINTIIVANIKMTIIVKWIMIISQFLNLNVKMRSW